GADRPDARASASSRAALLKAPVKSARITSRGSIQVHRSPCFSRVHGRFIRSLDTLGWLSLAAELKGRTPGIANKHGLQAGAPPRSRYRSRLRAAAASRVLSALGRAHLGLGRGPPRSDLRRALGPV